MFFSNFHSFFKEFFINLVMGLMIKATCLASSGNMFSKGDSGQGF